MPTQNIYDLVDTWNAGATTFTAVKMNVTDTASAAGSLLMDLQVGGSSKFKVDKTGAATFTGNIVASGVTGATSATMQFGAAAGTVYLGGGSGYGFTAMMQNNVFRLTNGTAFSWSSDANSYGGADTILTRRAAANLRLGAADAAAPVAQTLSVQSVVAGTTNTAGANLTITGSQGTGTGAGGSIVFQVAPAGSSGTAQNALATALTIDGSRNVTIDNASAVLQINRSGTSKILSYVDGGSLNSVNLASDVGLSWNSTTTATGSFDLAIFRDASNTLALRRGTNAQSFRVYNTTDGTNSEFGSLRWSSNRLDLVVEAAGTGTQRDFALMRGATTFMNTTSSGMNFPVNISTAGEIAIAAGDFYRWSTRSRMSSPADGIVAFNANTAANGSALQLTEMTAPAAPATNNVRIYAEDNGSGKTRLMALFPTGAAVQIAIEP